MSPGPLPRHPVGPVGPVVVASRADAPWLPAGGVAEVVVDADGEPPAPTGLVRLLLRRGDAVFCVPRSDTGKLDLPTSAVAGLDDGRGAAQRLARDVTGAPGDVTLLGFVRNVVPAPDEDYPWPVPVAHFSVWTAEAPPAVEGVWVSLTDAGSPLRDRHWWPLGVHQQAGAFSP